MISEVVSKHHIGSPSTSSSSSPLTAAGSSSPAVTTNRFDFNHPHMTQINHQFAQITLTNNDLTRTLMTSNTTTTVPITSSNSSTLTSSNPSPVSNESTVANSPQLHHNPTIGTTGPSMSLPTPDIEALSTTTKPKRSKLRPGLSLRLALSSSHQIQSSSATSPSSSLLPNPACSFDGCLPLSPSLQAHFLQKSDPLLSATAIDELQPVEILPKLFVGTMKSASDRSLLEKLNIGYIINVTTNLPNFFEERHPAEFKYLRIPLEDHWSGEISQYLDEAISFINNARLSERACLVHCLAGRSRSVAIVLAYIMYTYTCTLDEAYDLVKKRKPGVAPGLHFLRQLHDFEARFVSTRKATTETSVSTASNPSSESGCSGSSTPSSMSLSSFPDTNEISSQMETNRGPHFGNIAAVTMSSSRNKSNTFHSQNSHERSAFPPSLPSIDSAFTEDQQSLQTPAPGLQRRMFSVSADEAVK